MNDGEFFIQMVWNCPYCTHVNPGLSGEDRGLTCAGCGKKIDQRIEYHMPDDIQAAPIVTDPALLSLAEQKPLWECGQCGHKNREDMAECGNCGKPSRTETAQEASGPSTPPLAGAKPRPSSPPKPWTCQGCGTENSGSDATCRLCKNPSGHVAQTSTSAASRGAAQDLFPSGIDLGVPAVIPQRNPGTFLAHERIDISRVLMGILGAAVVAVICALSWWAFAPHRTTVTVTAMSWERVRVLERRIATPHEDWGRPSSPMQAIENLHCTPMPHGMEDYNPHKCGCKPGPMACDCTGGGTESCNPHPEKYCAEYATERKCEPKGNGAAKCRNVPTSTCKREATRTTYDQCSVPKKCSQCPEVCETCYDKRPKIEDWCAYDVITWNERARQTAHGTNRDPRWPVLEARDSGERIHSYELYVVSFSSPNGHWDKHYGSATDFLRFDLGQRYAAEYSRAGTLDVLNRLK